MYIERQDVCVFHDSAVYSSSFGCAFMYETERQLLFPAGKNKVLCHAMLWILHCHAVLVTLIEFQSQRRRRDESVTKRKSAQFVPMLSIVNMTRPTLVQWLTAWTGRLNWPPELTAWTGSPCHTDQGRWSKLKPCMRWTTWCQSEPEQTAAIPKPTTMTVTTTSAEIRHTALSPPRNKGMDWSRCCKRQQRSEYLTPFLSGIIKYSFSPPLM